MKLKVVVATLLASLIAISAAEARGPYCSINVGNWKGGAFLAPGVLIELRK